LKVLLITRECLRTDANEGNVLLNLFQDLPIELANIYCKPGLPDTELCGSYFQLTDRMALENILRHTPMGRAVQPVGAHESQAVSAEKENKRFYDFFRRHNLTLFHCARELLWKAADFKSPALASFICEFKPDVIFAPLCYSMYVLAVHRHAIGLAGCPAVTYIYDDIYSLKQFRLSPLYWINRLIQRRIIRKTLPYYQFAYTMTQQQADEYSRMLPIPMRVLRKCADVPDMTPKKQAPHDGARLIYAGGVYYGRDKTLARVAESLRALNAEGRRARLDIYTSSPLSAAMRKQLDDGSVSFVHPVVPFDELQALYGESDIALHVESFRLKYALLTRLSFSTKIVDCLASGCAVLAICPDINAGWQYLLSEDAAVCVCREDDISSAVRGLIESPAQKDEYARKALDCLQRNHRRQDIGRALQNDLEAYAG